MKLYAVVAQYGRHDMCYSLIDQLREEGVVPIVVDTDLENRLDRVEGAYHILYRPEPFNLSLVWQKGMLAAEMLQAFFARVSDPWAVAILNNDLKLSPGCMRKLGDALLETNTDISFPDQYGHGKNIVDKTPPGTPADLSKRMTGYCFMVRGGSDIFPNEELVWWCGDGDMEQQAKSGRGTVLVGGATVEHFDPDGYTGRMPELQVQANIDVQTFKKIWGFPPVEGW